MSAHKYQDADVRDNANLMALAVQYARLYRGDFPFMQAAAAAANATGTLPIGVARGVLNCMRTDARWADKLPEPMGPDPIDWTDFDEKPKPRLVLVDKVIGPRYKPARSIRVKHRLKHPYFWNPERWEGALKYTYHVISAYSYVDMFVSPHHGGSQTLQLHLKGLCGHWHNKGQVRTGPNPPSDFRMCGSCAKQLEVAARKYQRERNLGK